MAGYIGTQAVSVNTTSATISDDLAVGDDATIAGTLGVTGVLTATSLDISGAIDVDGAANFAADVTIATGADLLTASAGVANVKFGPNTGASIASGGNNNVMVGDSAGKFATTAVGSVFVGPGAGLGITGTKLTGNGNIAIGSNAGAVLQGAAALNVLIGAECGDAITVGSNSVAIGFRALGTETGGQDSVAIGTDALATQNFTSSGTRSGNVAVGLNAGKAITTGQANTMIGGFAGDATNDGANNTAVGNTALSANCGNNNVAVGASAGIAITGETNTCVGESAGNAITSGNANICLGQDSDVSSAGNSNSICIGVGITAASNDFSFGKTSNVVTNDFDADAAFTRSSDSRLKNNVANATLGLDFVNDLRPVTYKWKASADLDANDAELAHLRVADDDGNIINHMTTDITMHGLIAQEVKTALDTANVSNFKGWSKDSYGVQQISREMYVIPLIKAVQELSTALDAALARITTLEG